MIAIVRLMGRLIPLGSMLGAAIAYGQAIGDGTISGTVKGAANTPVMGAFVGARNAGTKITVKVLTDKYGRYRIQDLPPGDYEVRAAAVGYPDAVRSGIKIVDSTDLEVKATNETVDLQLEARSAGESGDASSSSFTDMGMRIVYVEYEAPPNSRPVNAAPDKEGKIWVSYPGTNAIARLDPVNGAMEEYPVGAVSSVFPGSDGAVWFVHQSSNKLSKWDPRARAVSEYPAQSGSHLTVRAAPDGSIWASNPVGPLSRFNPLTGTYTYYSDASGAAGLVIDKDGNAWFTESSDGGGIGRVEAGTGAVKRWTPPTQNAWPRRIQVDRPSGMIWFTESRGRKVGRFDPKTETFREYPLTDAVQTPEAVGIDNQSRIWYSSEKVVACLDSNDGRIVEFPFPYAQIQWGDLSTDTDGRVWWTSPANDKFGYFYLNDVRQYTFYGRKNRCDL